MERREFVASTCCAICGAVAGCTTAEEPDPKPEIAFLELENHRREESYEFAVRIEDEDRIVFEETIPLGGSGTGSATVALEEPVAEPGAYVVRVEAAGHSATADTRNLVSDEEPCLGLRFYLGPSTLHLEHLSYQRCE